MGTPRVRLAKAGRSRARRVRTGRVRGVTAVTGLARVGTVALALLVCACVFIALAGPGVSLRVRTQALHDLVGPAGSLGTAVGAQASWTAFTSAYHTGTLQNLSEDEFSSSTIFIGDGLAATPLPIAAGGWGSLTTGLHGVVAGTRAGPPGIGQQLEVTFRDPLTSNVQLVSGQLGSAAIPRGAVGVALTAPTAARFGLHPDSRLELASQAGPVTLVVTAIVRQRDPAASFWTADPLVAAPVLSELARDQGEVWQGAVFADPGELVAMQSAFCQITAESCSDLQLQWEFPVAVNTVTADQAQALYDGLALTTGNNPAAISADLGSSATALTVGSPLTGTVAEFLATQAAVLTVPLLVFVSLILLGAVVIVLAARMIVTGREGELANLRARGASVRQVAMLVLGGAAVAAVPGAAVGVVLASELFPGTITGSGGSAMLSRVLAAVTLIAGLAGPPLIAAWWYRNGAPGERAVSPAPAVSGESSRARFSAPALRRLTAEAAACLLAVAGLVSLRVEGLAPAGRINWFVTAAPVLVAVPAVLITLRLYPLAIRGLLRIWGRRAGATGYIALAGSARSSLVTTGPIFTLALAMTVAAFAGMVNGAIASGEVASSWQATGADAVVSTDAVVNPVTAGVQKSLLAVPGVRHVTAVWNTTWQTASGRTIEAAAVDPAGYAGLTADTPFPRVAVAPAGRAVTPGTVIDVLASPSAAAALGAQASTLTSDGPGPVRVHVTGIVTSTPAFPGGGMFIIMPLQTLPGVDGRPAPDMILVSGSGFSQARLTAIVGTELPAASVTFRAAVLAGLVNSPLPSVAVHLMLLGVFIAACFGLLNLIFGLALGARDRELTLARLTVMGYDRPRSLVMLQELPAVVVAAAAAAAGALALPTLVGPSLDLSVFFSGASVPVEFRPDLAALVQVAGGIAVLAGVALAIATGRARRRDVTGALRAH
jgi:putative ABC transport system permease protein